MRLHLKDCHSNQQLKDGNCHILVVRICAFCDVKLNWLTLTIHPALWTKFGRNPSITSEITKASITVATVNSMMTYIDSEKSFLLSFWSFFSPFCHAVQIKPVFYWLTLYDLMPPACRSPWVLNPWSLADFILGLFFRLSLLPAPFLMDSLPVYDPCSAH